MILLYLSHSYLNYLTLEREVSDLDCFAVLDVVYNKLLKNLNKKTKKWHLNHLMEDASSEI